MQTAIRLSALFVALGFTATLCLAQMDRATLNGTVTDSSGAVVPGTKISAVQKETKATFKTVTNASGVFNFIGLPIGSYEVSAEKEGFSRSVAPNVVLTANSDIRVDVRLTPGAVTQQVQVEASSPLVEERSSAYGVDVQKQVLDDLPLQVSGGIRSVYSFLNVVPGVSNAGFANNIMGGVGMYSQVLVDGVSAEYNPGVAGVMSDPPSVEAIGEFKVVNTISAEYGLTGGSFMSFVTKSGTNDLHGDAFEFLRNNAMDARSFFAPTVSIEKQNEFGFTAGGPVYIPKVYNGRNKTFFFGTFTQYIYHYVTEGQILTLPTDAFKSGDFSSLLGSQVGTDSLGRPVYAGEIYDPNSTRSDGKGGYIRDPFPGNVIPQSKQSLVSQKWQSYLPSVPGNQIANNFNGASGLNTSNSKAFFAKGDQVIGQGRLSGSFKMQRDNSFSSCVLPPQYCGSLNISDPWSTRLAYTQVFRPNIVGEFNFGVDRTAGPGGISSPEQSVFSQTIGLKGVLAPEAPFLNIQGGYPGDGYFGTHNPKQAENNRNTKFNASTAWFKGTHSIKFGGNFFRWDSNFHTDTLANGQFQFNSGQTGLPGDFLSQTGFGYASFLMGQVGYVQVKGPEDHGERSWAMGYFIQDEWRVNPRLTLNYGLRYDYQPQYTSPHHQGSSFDGTIPNPGAGNYPGALTFLTASKTRFSDTYKLGFGPRFGFAFKLDTKTVMRGSYGLFYGPVSQLSGEIATRQGYVPRFALASTDGISPAFNWDNGIPTPPNFITPTLDPTIANGSATAFLGKNDGRPAQIQLVNFGFQRELPKDIVAEVAYVGNFSHHIATNTMEQINQLNYAKYGYLGQLLTAPFDSPQAVAAGITAPYPGFQGTVAQALRPYPQYLGINDVNAMIGNSTYHAMQVKLQKRFSNGLSFLIGYTLSKNLTDVDSTAGYFSSSVQDAYNRRAEKAVSSIDSPNQVVASYTYELPFGPGKRLLNSKNAFNRFVAGGWAISGIQTYRTGTPLGVVTSTVLPTTNDSLSLSGTPVRPNMVNGVDPLAGIACSSFDPQTDLYLNKAAFTAPAPFTFGNAPRELSNARACPTLEEDISVMKYVPIRENRVNLRFGADAFNVLNRRKFGGPDTNYNDPGFGTISGAGPGRVLQLQFKILW
ncbi:MAG: carboxypeptidase regulatory-like domain-containing protein [Bryobacteraceae bacterium]